MGNKSVLALRAWETMYTLLRRPRRLHHLHRLCGQLFLLLVWPGYRGRCKFYLVPGACNAYVGNQGFLCASRGYWYDVKFIWHLWRLSRLSGDNPILIRASRGCGGRCKFDLVLGARISYVGNRGFLCASRGYWYDVKFIWHLRRLSRLRGDNHFIAYRAATVTMYIRPAPTAPAPPM